MRRAHGQKHVLAERHVVESEPPVGVGRSGRRRPVPRHRLGPREPHLHVRDGRAGPRLGHPALDRAALLDHHVDHRLLPRLHLGAGPGRPRRVLLHRRVALREDGERGHLAGEDALHAPGAVRAGLRARLSGRGLGRPAARPGPGVDSQVGPRHRLAEQVRDAAAQHAARADPDHVRTLVRGLDLHPGERHAPGEDDGERPLPVGHRLEREPARRRVGRRGRGRKALPPCQRVPVRLDHGEEPAVGGVHDAAQEAGAQEHDEPRLGLGLREGQGHRGPRAGPRGRRPRRDFVGAPLPARRLRVGLLLLRPRRVDLLQRLRDALLRRLAAPRPRVVLVPDRAGPARRHAHAREPRPRGVHDRPADMERGCGRLSRERPHSDGQARPRRRRAVRGSVAVRDDLRRGDGAAGEDGPRDERQARRGGHADPRRLLAHARLVPPGGRPKHRLSPRATPGLPPSLDERAARIVHGIPG